MIIDMKKNLFGKILTIIVIATIAAIFPCCAKPPAGEPVAEIPSQKEEHIPESESEIAPSPGAYKEFTKLIQNLTRSIEKDSEGYEEYIKFLQLLEGLALSCDGNEEYLKYLTHLALSYGKNVVVFDFDELSEADLPRGEQSINNLIASFGTPEPIYAECFPGLSEIVVIIRHKDIRVRFRAGLSESFSVYNELKQNSDEPTVIFDLSEEDREITMDVESISFHNNIIEFPNNIKIGQYTKDDVLEAYPPDSENVRFDDMLCYSYGWNIKDNAPGCADGCMDYYFDELGVLQQIGVSWYPTRHLR